MSKFIQRSSFCNSDKVPNFDRVSNGKIYWYWKDQKFPDETGNRTCKAIFLQDIADLEKAGVKHKYFTKVKKMMR